MRVLTVILASVLSVVSAVYTFADGTHPQIVEMGTQRCAISDGLPDHAVSQVGRNPARPQALRLCFPTHPQKTQHRNEDADIVGVLLNGVLVRPHTAEFYDPSAPRGFSRNPASGWRLDALGNQAIFRVDQNNGHADHRGLYHYHAMPAALIPIGSDTLIGYAADGHEIHYVGSAAQSSYILKSGTRPSGPGGRYDGTYTEDYAFVSSAGNLDACNGARLDGKYVYFATETYPYFQRCHYGVVSQDFIQKGFGAGQGPTPGARLPRHPPQKGG